YIAENNFFYSGLNEGCDLTAIAIEEIPSTTTTTTTEAPILIPVTVVQPDGTFYRSCGEGMDGWEVDSYITIDYFDIDNNPVQQLVTFGPGSCDECSPKTIWALKGTAVTIKSYANDILVPSAFQYCNKIYQAYISEGSTDLAISDDLIQQPAPTDNVVNAVYSYLLFSARVFTGYIRDLTSPPPTTTTTTTLPTLLIDVCYENIAEGANIVATTFDFVFVASNVQVNYDYAGSLGSIGSGFAIIPNGWATATSTVPLLPTEIIISITPTTIVPSSDSSYIYGFGSVGYECTTTPTTTTTTTVAPVLGYSTVSGSQSCTEPTIVLASYTWNGGTGLCDATSIESIEFEF
ncbi:MAG: hypothetical protein ACR2HS_03845, partial [Gammaproteobacteria bacterium]